MEENKRRDTILAVSSLGSLGVILGAIFMGAVANANEPDTYYNLSIKDGEATYNCSVESENGDVFNARIIDGSMSLYQYFDKPVYKTPADASSENIEVANAYCDTGVVPEL